MTTSQSEAAKPSPDCQDIIQERDLQTTLHIRIKNRLLQNARPSPQRVCDGSDVFDTGQHVLCYRTMMGLSGGYKRYVLCLASKNNPKNL